MLPEDEDAAAPGHHRKFVVAGRTLTMTQAAIIGICVLAVFFAILAAFGVFSGSSPTTPTVVAPPKPLTNTTPTTTQSTTTATTQGPEQQLKPGDTGSQVKLLQEALVTLGFLSSKPDGVYGPVTQNAVEKFQLSAGITADGIRCRAAGCSTSCRNSWRSSRASDQAGLPSPFSSCGIRSSKRAPCGRWS